MTPALAIHTSAPTYDARGRAKTPRRPKGAATPKRVSVDGDNTSDRAIPVTTPKTLSLGRDQAPSGHIRPDAQKPRAAGPILRDPTLSTLADMLSDLERTRIACENRLRQLTRVAADKDGEERGFGMTDDAPAVVAQRAIVTGLEGLEHQAELDLNRSIRKHPLGAWQRSTDAKGVGERQLARLLGCIGDPYWNDLHDRPRTVSELWAYCGLHTLPADHAADGAHECGVGGDQTSGPGHGEFDAHQENAWVAARRRKGVKSNWSADAKMRAWNIAVSCMKSDGHYREVYDQRRAVTAERIHAAACVRCGPAGKPALPGSAWSKSHQLADALRIVSKEVLRDLWRVARDIHGETP